VQDVAQLLMEIHAATQGSHIKKYGILAEVAPQIFSKTGGNFFMSSAI
jgi:hypothetical protein